jgi:hypothetical protein
MLKQEEGSGGAAAAAAAAALPSSDEDLHGTSLSENEIQHLSLLLSLFPGGRKLRTIATETTMRK